jgi:hypothetical protein
MDGVSELASNSLTFPEGTGIQSFIFRATDNELLDGGRSFNLKLTGNSAGYRVGVNKTGEGANISVAVRDDEHPLKSWTGKWTVLEMNGTAPADWAFDVNLVGGEASDELIIEAFPVYAPDVMLDITMIMDAEAGTVVIAPASGMDSNGYGIYRMAKAVLDDNGDIVEIVDEPVSGVINEDGTILLNGALVFEIIDGSNAGLTFSYWVDMLFSR